jgi:hypothetical protein
MSTTLLPPVAPPPPPEHIDDSVPAEVVPPDIAAYRRRLRRRMVLFSLPVVVIAVLVALKLLSMPALAALSQATYDAHDYDRSIQASDGLGVVNVFEPWVRHFDRGTGLARIGVLTDARSELESAMALVPASNSAASCRVRTDLVLVVEEQGDGALLDQQYTEAESFYAHALSLYKGAPEGCFRDPETNQNAPSKKPLNDAKNRLEQKQSQAQQQGGQGQGQQGQGGSSGQSQQGQGGSSGQSQGQGGSSGQGQGQGSPGSGGSGSSGSGSSGASGQDPLQQLQQQDDQSQTEQQQNDDRQRYFQQNPEDYSGKPW